MFGVISISLSSVPAIGGECGQPAANQSTTQQPTPGSSKAVQLADAAQQQLTREHVTGLSFGDSIMFGWPPDLLTQTLGTPTLNAAVGGGTDTLLWQLEQGKWSGQSPRYVLVMIGTNNLSTGACPTYWGIEAVVTKLRQTFLGAKIIVVSILPRGEDLRAFEDQIAQVNENLKQASASGKHLFLDAHEAFVCDHHTPCDLFDSTNLHLTRPGYVILTAKLNALISANTQ